MKPACTLDMMIASTVVTLQNRIRLATVRLGGCRNPKDVAYNKKDADITVNIAHVASASLKVFSIQVGVNVEFVRGQSVIVSRLYVL